MYMHVTLVTTGTCIPHHMWWVGSIGREQYDLRHYTGFNLQFRVRHYMTHDCHKGLYIGNIARICV